MDRNTIIGLVLIAGIVFTWSVFFAPKDSDNPQPKTPTEAPISVGNGASSDEMQPVKPTGTSVPLGYTDSLWSSMTDSAKTAVLAAEKQVEHGEFSRLYQGEDRVIEVETENLKVQLHTKGGLVGNLWLKNFRTHDSLILPIQNASQSSNFSLNFRQLANVKFPNVSTRELYFVTDFAGDKLNLTGDSSQVVNFYAKLDQNHYFQFSYDFRGNTYDYGFNVSQNQMNGLIENQAIEAVWETDIPKTEKAMALMRAKTAMYYHESDAVEWLNPKSAMDAPEVPEGRIDWIAFHSQFFTYTMMTADEKQTFIYPKLFQYDPVGEDLSDPMSGDIVKHMTAKFDLDIATTPTGTSAYTVYAGPLDVDILGSYKRDMVYQVEMGYGPLKYVNRYMIIPVFNFLEGIFSSYGLIIFLLALFIKLLTYPMTWKTYLSTAKMRIVNQTPEIKALDEKYKDDPTKLQQEKMGIYRQLGVSMFGGCWPMLLQYPFLVALFFFFPNSIELRQQGFLWAPDLSTYDSVLDLGFNIPWYGDHVSLFTLLMTASVFAYTIINQKMQAQVVANPVMKYFPYIMPIILLGFLNSYSAGLSWYYLVSNLLSITQTMVTKRFVNEDKLLAQMRENAKKKAADPNKKKGTLAKWAEKQQARQRDAMAERNGPAPKGGSGRGKNQTAPKKRK